MHTFHAAEHYLHLIIRRQPARRTPGILTGQIAGGSYLEGMNMQMINLSMPYRRIQRRVDETRKFIGNYVYYRKRNHKHIDAWRMASNTL